MRRLATLALATALVIGALTVPGNAASRAAKKASRGVATTLYFHGTLPAGEGEELPGIVTNTFMGMDTKAPTDSTSKSKAYGWGDSTCAGNRAFDVWIGNVSGTITGNLTLDFSSVSIPQDVQVRIWPDVTQLMCTSTYPSPAIQQNVTLPSGQAEVKATLKNVKLSVQNTLMIQISPAQLGTDTPGPGRIFYDGTNDPSHLSFTCVPASGTSCS
jgi:hypothetical protein